MKAALIQRTVPTSTGTQNFTNSAFSSDAKNLLLFGGLANANDTDTANGSFGIGSTDKTRLGSASIRNRDNVTDSICSDHGSSALCFGIAGDTSGVDSEANLAGVAHPSDGVQVNWADVQDGQILINGLLLGGDDIEVSTVTASFTNAVAPETVAVAHQLSDMPDLLIAFTHNGPSDSSSGGAARMSMGFYDRRANQYVGATFHRGSGLAAAQDGARLSTSWLLGQNEAGTNIAYTVTVGSFTATQFSMTASAQTNDLVTFICLRGRNAPLNQQIGILSTPTATGDFTAISGMAGTPSAVLWLPTRMIAVGGSSSDNAGLMGMGASVNNRGVTQQGCSVESDDDGASTIDARSRTSNTKSIVIINQSGAVSFEAAVSQWTPDGLVLNASTVEATSRQVPYCAFGMPAPLVLSHRVNTLLRM